MQYWQWDTTLVIPLVFIYFPKHFPFKENHFIVCLLWLRLLPVTTLVILFVFDRSGHVACVCLLSKTFSVQGKPFHFLPALTSTFACNFRTDDFSALACIRKKIPLWSFRLCLSTFQNNFPSRKTISVSVCFGEISGIVCIFYERMYFCQSNQVLSGVFLLLYQYFPWFHVYFPRDGKYFWWRETRIFSLEAFQKDVFFLFWSFCLCLSTFKNIFRSRQTVSFSVAFDFCFLTGCIILVTQLDEWIRIKIWFQCFHLIRSGENCVSQVFHHC